MHFLFIGNHTAVCIGATSHLGRPLERKMLFSQDTADSWVTRSSLHVRRLLLTPEKRSRRLLELYCWRVAWLLMGFGHTWTVTMVPRAVRS